jgi:5-carboxymethyl-2-hydroxymuconic-semialdehyde dehydrogenase
MTATWKTAPCLALGNTAVLKMSELSPLTADRLGELALEAGIPAGVLNVVQGYGATAGDALVRHKDVRAVSFTGGTATGRRIIENAGLKKFSMELGGKSPVLIFEDADIERALDAALFTIFSINGERCTAGSRIFIQESIYPEFVKRFAERANRLRVGDPQDPNTQVGALISQQHWEKVSGYIRLGLEEGATLLAVARTNRLASATATSCGQRCWRMSTTGCASRRRRFSGQWPACCRSNRKKTACAWPTTWSTAWRRTSGRRM